MLIDFNNLKEVTIPSLNGGEGEVSARMFMDQHGKVMTSRIPKGSSIGVHTHNTSCEYNFVLSGFGKAVCDNAEEMLAAGVCHYCPNGSTHKIINTGDEDLVLITVVCEKGENHA